MYYLSLFYLMIRRTKTIDHSSQLTELILLNKKMR
jgi:hypothetical protein